MDNDRQPQSPPPAGADHPAPTDAARAQARIAHLYQALRAIANVNQLIVRERDPERLLQQACDLLIADRGYYNAWILLLDGQQQVTAWAQAGVGEAFQHLLDQWKRGQWNTCARQALAQGELVAIDDPPTHCAECPLAQGYGARGALIAQLKHGGTVRGLICASIPANLVSDQEEQALLREIAGDLAFALHSIELEATRDRLVERLQESERRYRELFQRSRDGFVIVDAQGHFLDANRAYCEMVGYTVAELRQLDNFLSITPERWREWEWTEIWERRLLGRGYSGIYEKEYIRKDGTIIPVEFQSYAVRDEAGHLDYLWGVVRDITARKAAERELLQERANLSALIENTDGLIWSVDQEQRLIVGNAAFRRTIQAGRGQPFKPGESVLPSDQAVRQEWLGYYQRALAGEAFAVETPRYFTGPVGYMEYRFSPIRDADDRLVGVTVFGRDTTERHQAEQALQESQRLLTATGKMGHIGGWEHDLATGKASWTEPLHDIIGIPNDQEPPGVDEHLDYYPPTDRAVMEQAYQSAVERGIPFDLELQVHNAAGDLLWCRVQGEPVMRDGDCVTMRGTFQDITARKRAERAQERLRDQLAQALKMESVGRLAGGVAHDFNNMLQAIIGNVYLALDYPNLDDGLEESLRDIAHAAERSADLTRQLLAFARKQVIAPVPLDLNDAVSGMLRMLRRLIGEEIELAWKPGAELWPVHMDPSQLDQVLANLCVNARDAIDGIGQITIETRNIQVAPSEAATNPDANAGDYVLLAVADTGHGMSEHVLAHLFEPFFTTKAVGEGTGLGLATVYGIVRQNGGFIQVQSAPDSGSRFSLYFPRDHDLVAVEELGENGHIAPGHGETILLVEDEPAVLRLSQRLLRAFGYQVLSAATPRKALALAAAHDGPLDLLITDVVMPQMSGRRLLEALRVNQPRLRCLFMSGYTADVIAERGVLEEGLHFLQKPFTPRDLAAKVREALE